MRLPALLVLALATAACGCKARSNDVPVGAYLSLSGVDATFGTDTKEGIISPSIR